ncbi:hypothetical protein ACFFJN_11600 [Erwinia mallotivora]|uniref:hypothetical protein n=1 Tax=Erwinia mallotivora TaxID=69222 RepID=UPI0035E7F2ED
MSVITCIKANIFHSSSAAFSLALKDPKNINLATRLITVKNQNAHCDLIKAHSDLTREIQINSRINKYQGFLDALLLRSPETSQKKDISDFNNSLPRLTSVSKNANDHQYFLPYDDQLQLVSYTSTNESLI